MGVVVLKIVEVGSRPVFLFGASIRMVFSPSSRKRRDLALAVIRCLAIVIIVTTISLSLG
jgi:hypothetical protein